ncbi:hypothetical protein D7D52_32010 [Nocardia yunnanensis]|uniref:Uncharacterized protein n=1 Tax=Nocardia yunnanensis TaxID=2382165 RepID=A0A386ZJC2_9NOCA|nr:hypothetical protein [Nocardia yunnanensis]AYF77677.1 hypothetical protein D7D52_32010 [Nocardia yunnanensis]
MATLTVSRPRLVRTPPAIVARPLALVSKPLGTGVRAALGAGAMVLILAAMTAAFVSGAMPAVAGPTDPAPTLVKARAQLPAPAPAMTSLADRP